MVAPGANLKLALPPASVTAGARGVLAQLETALAPVGQVFATAPAGCTRVLHAAPSLTAGSALFEACNVLVLNDTELAAYASIPACPKGLEEISRLARGWLRRSEQAAVVTLGAAARSW